MSMLEDTERKQFLNILLRHPFLENDRKRRALLINSGLEHLLSEIDTAGSSRDFVHLLYAALTHTLLPQSAQDLWFISLLTYLLDFSGPQDFRQEDQKFLTCLRQKLRQKRAGRETPSVSGGHTDSPVSPPLLQPEAPVSGEQASREGETSYLKYMVKSLEWLEITGLPTEVIAQSAPLDEIFIPLQLRPNRPLTEYPLTEWELAEYYRRLQQQLPLRDLERYVFEAEKNWSTRERRAMSMHDFWQSLTKERPAAIIQGYPGAGKSTLLKYLALYMARRCLKQRSRAVLAPLTPALTPFLISLGDFANERSRTAGISLIQYVQLKLSRLHIPGLALFLEERLNAGQCLILLDGLDEISDHRMRIEIQGEIREFVLTCSDLFDESSLFNRFLVTTRVAGYDQAAFPAYPHYTIAELTPEQIDTFLPRWCRAIVRLDPAFVRAAEHEPARFAQEVQQRTEELHTSIHQRPELQTLVENPLLLTMLALMQQNRIEVPRQRADLYRIFTQTLLERRSEVRGTPLIPETQAILRLGPLALRMQETNNSFLHENEVIASLINTISLEGTIVDPRQEADAFLYKLRVQVGIFALRAGDYYGFFHRTFQEYFTARSLIHTFIHHPGEVGSFIDTLCKQYDTWREPFLLAIAYASGKHTALANTLLHMVLTMPPQIAAEEQELHLQIAIESLIEAKPASLDPALERQVAELALQLYEQAQQNRMFGRCANIEEFIARWLSCFPEHLYHSTFMTVLCTAISQNQQPAYQHAALTLLARIIEQHNPWPASVLTRVIPPLLAIAGLPTAGQYQPALGAGASANLLAKDLALINLSMLGMQGPAGFLPARMQQHFSDHPDLLHTLARHSIASGVLLTPTIIPRKDESSRQWPGDIALQQWLLQRDRFHAGHQWHRYEDLCLSIHQDLLAHAEEMRYPLTLHMIQVLEQAQHHPEQPWQRVWQDYLAGQMNAGQYISYQESTLLWGCLFQEQAELQKLADLILSDFRSDGSDVQRYAERFLATLADCLRIQEELGECNADSENQFSPHLRFWLDISEIYYIQDRQNLRIWRYLRDMHNLQNFRDMQGEDPLHNPQYIHTLQALLLTPEVTRQCLARLTIVPFHQDEYADLLTILLGRVLSFLHIETHSDAIKEELCQIVRGIHLDIPPIERDDRSAVTLEILGYLRFLPVHLPVDTAEEVRTVLQLAEKIPEQWVQQLCDAAREQATPMVLQAGERLLKASSHAKETTMDHDCPVCDICIVCALSEEAEAFIQETSDLCHVTFQRTFGPHTRREYRYATIQNNKGEPLTIYLTWLPRYGPEEMALHFKPVLAELQPWFAAMTGICAGDKERVACGDLIVAERAFLSNTGKIVSDRQGHRQQLYDTHTYHPHPDILQFVQMFDSWQAEIARLSRPIPMRQQRAWLLTTLLQKPALRITDLPLQELEQHAPAWTKIASELQYGPHPMLTKEGVLQDLANARELLSLPDYLSKDRTIPRRHIAAIASSSAVRSDNPFQEIQVPVRGAIAIDMEGATFYRTVAEFAGLRALLVKGVCDYADPDKDDTYHDYAAAASARYLLCFIKDYVTTALMARPTYSLPLSDAGARNLQPQSNDQQHGQDQDRPSSYTLSVASQRTDTLKKEQREQLHRALLSAFPSRSELKQMVDFGLDQNLDQITSAGNLDQTVFELIKWAETRSQERALILAAYRANPGNGQLQTFVSQMPWLRDPAS